MSALQYLLIVVFVSPCVLLCSLLLHVSVYGVIECTINPIIFSPLKLAIFDLTAF